eukprot:738218-Amphidinium_carterae.1
MERPLSLLLASVSGGRMVQQSLMHLGILSVDACIAIGAAHPQEFAEAISLLARDSPEHYRVWSDYSVCLQELWVRMTASISTLDQQLGHFGSVKHSELVAHQGATSSEPCGTS